jgi:two-component system sensor histidine kinase PilS (NtrC family)
LINICAITLLAYASGGAGSGLGMLMIAPLAGASFLTHGRLAPGIAALGALALLCGELYADLHK